MSSRTNRRGINILMYHSISSEPGPTSISPQIFRQQIRTLRECGYHSIALAELVPWLLGEKNLSDKSVILTFDDGFSDFVDTAYPILSEFGFSATVFLPTGCIGKIEDWSGAYVKPRQLMTWQQVRDLAVAGVEFGGHSVTHVDLTKLDARSLEHEIRQAQDDICDHLGRPTSTFAPPYGQTNAAVQSELAHWSRVSVGTTLGRAERENNIHDLPRIEMYYFRNVQLWRAYLMGHGDWYVSLRRAAREARQLATRFLESDGS